MMPAPDRFVGYNNTMKHADDRDKLLQIAECAEVRSTIAHHGLMPEEEAASRHFSSIAVDGVWVAFEGWGPNRVAKIDGLGLSDYHSSEMLTLALRLATAEKPDVLRVKVASTRANASLHASLTQLGFRHERKVLQWITDATQVAEPDPNIDIREIGASDADTFARIVAVNYRAPKDYDLERYARLVGAPGFAAFMAYDGGTAIATGLVHVESDASALGYGTTLKAYRGRGIQQAMIAARVRAAHKLGATWATASTWGKDRSSRNLKRQGFHLAGEVIVYVRP
jgi:GNAT superfamily N-acetyltransferase